MVGRWDGEVYRARDTRLGRFVAVKVLAALLSSNPELRERLEREAQTISNLNHPHIRLQEFAALGGRLGIPKVDLPVRKDDQ